MFILFHAETSEREPLQILKINSDVVDVTTSIKRRKWIPSETFKLIEARMKQEIEMRQGMSKRKLWKGVSENLAEVGFDRNPEQCKAVWFSLVKKYKVGYSSSFSVANVVTRTRRVVLR